MAVQDSYFFFNNKLFKQIDGVAMGSPLGPSLANAFLCYYEQIWLNNCPIEFKPMAYFRYVDDTFIIFRNPEHAPLFLNYLNSRHSSMRFTCEQENNGSLSFLDLTIKKCNDFFVHLSLER